jgi:acetyl-CoA synthetase
MKSNLTKETIIMKGQYNIGHICSRQQCDTGRSDHIAMRWISPNLERTDYTYADIEKNSNRTANLLIKLGISPGNKVFIFHQRHPIYILHSWEY